MVKRVDKDQITTATRGQKKRFDHCPSLEQTGAVLVVLDILPR